MASPSQPRLWPNSPINIGIPLKAMGQPITAQPPVTWPVISQSPYSFLKSCKTKWRCRKDPVSQIQIHHLNQKPSQYPNTVHLPCLLPLWARSTPISAKFTHQSKGSSAISTNHQRNDVTMGNRLCLGLDLLVHGTRYITLHCFPYTPLTNKQHSLIVLTE